MTARKARLLPRGPGPLRTALAINASALVCAVLVWLAVDGFAPLARVNQFLQDWEITSSFAATAPQDPDIVVVAIDEDTLRQFPYRSPVDRKYVADLIRALEKHGPKVIGLDLCSTSPPNPTRTMRCARRWPPRVCRWW